MLLGFFEYDDTKINTLGSMRSTRRLLDTVESNRISRNGLLFPGVLSGAVMSVCRASYVLDIPRINSR